MGKMKNETRRDENGGGKPKTNANFFFENELKRGPRGGGGPTANGYFVLIT